MKFGLDLFPDRGPKTKSAEQYFYEALELTELADSLGYESVKMVEHYFYPYGGYSPNPLIFLAAAASRTKRMRLITGCVLPAFSHPLKQAAELAMLDAISGGRLDVGFARAFIPGEFDAFGVSMDESRDRFNEGVEAVLQAWKGEHFSFKGKFYQWEDVQSLPIPTQKPHPPVWQAVVATPQSYEEAGRLGRNLMVVPYLADFDVLEEHIELYRNAYRNSGHGEPTKDNIMMVLHTYIADTTEQAYEDTRDCMQEYVEVFKEAASTWNKKVSSDYKKYNALPSMLDAMTFEKIVSEKRAAIGTADEVYEIIKEVTDRFGVGHLTLQQHFGGLEFIKAKKNIERFAEKVMPRFNQKEETVESSVKVNA
ncbi:LLM class flavin-dependent oxidoreductase [Bacillus sp. M6-12]|uniref:LLM class flavin-dependent oxidoreductase n=1 Tax=Bacillus sp. M6-12 TaxID=2054166 RepID=UPI0015E07A54|nr:LLM class flavin-dependent oxidoreductase [Bacillus sp. M6-12]